MPHHTSPEPETQAHTGVSMHRPRDQPDLTTGPASRVGPVKTVRLRVDLRNVAPTVLRVVDVPAAATLAELHEVLQAVVGWQNFHLHEFTAGQTTYGLADPDGPAGQVDETTVQVGDLPERFSYLYDFGDGWEHDIAVMGVGADRPGCVYGEGQCPPEDCGGPQGYANLVKVLADPTDAEHHQMRRWAGDWPDTDFDQAAADTRARWAIGEVPPTVRLLLDMLREPVRLTPGGRLPRVLVRQVQDQRPDWHPLGRPARIEEDLRPLAVAHDLFRTVGLLRLRNGTLHQTRAAGDDLQVVRRLRSWFSPNTLQTAVTRLAITVLATGGPQAVDQLAATVHKMLDRRSTHSDGTAITEEDVHKTLYQLSPVLTALDLIIQSEWRTRARTWIWTAGPAARSLLPGTATLADHVTVPAPH